MRVDNHAGKYDFGDDVLGKQFKVSSLKSLLRDAPLPWLLAVNSTSMAAAYWLLLVSLSLIGSIFISDALLGGATPLQLPSTLLVLGGALFVMGIIIGVWRPSPPFVELAYIGNLAVVQLVLWVAVVFIPDFELRHRSLVFTGVFFNTFPSLLDLRFLPAIFMYSWVCIGNFVAAYASGLLWGDTFTVRKVGMVVLIGFMYFCQARLHHFRLRCLYDVQRHGLEHVSAIERVLAMISDGSVWLASDGDRICKCDERLKANLGISVAEGQRLSDAFSDISETERFAQTIKSACKGPALVTISFENRISTNERLDVEVLIVNVEGTLHAPYLACFRRVSQDEPPRFFDGADTCASSAVSEVEPPVCPHETFSEGSDLQDMVSLPETTSTGHLFEAVRLAVQRNQCIDRLIAQVVDLGVREQWLLHGHTVDLKPDVILGSGGFGSVIEADYLGLRVAVKVPNSSEDGKSRIAVMLNELRVLRRVRHPNVVLFFGVYISDDKCDVGLVFERIAGVSLDKCVESLPCHTTKLGIALNLCCALWYLHWRTPVIVHGDIKSANVLMEVRGDSIIAKLADFGLSRLVSKTSMILGGSYHWLAPEIIRSSFKERPKMSADVFSFGRLLFCIMFGTNKFCDWVSHDTIRNMANLNIVIPFRMMPLTLPLSRETYAICERCILVDATQRPTIPTLHSALSQWSNMLTTPQDKRPTSPTAWSALSQCSDTLTASHGKSSL